MAFFNKEAERNIRPESAGKAPLQAQPQPSTISPVGPMPERNVAPRASLPEMAGNVKAYLDTGTRVSGKLFFEGPARIDGQIEGEISAKETVIIGESAVVNAQVRAATIIVAGRVNGDLIAAERIEVRPSAKVVGNLTTPVLVIQEGALFEGHCTMQVEAVREGKVAALHKEERAPQVAVAQKQV